MHNIIDEYDDGNVKYDVSVNYPKEANSAHSKDIETIIYLTPQNGGNVKTIYCTKNIGDSQTVYYRPYNFSMDNFGGQDDAVFSLNPDAWNI